MVSISGDTCVRRRCRRVTGEERGSLGLAQATTDTNTETGRIAGQRPDSSAKNLMWLASAFLVLGVTLMSVLLIKLSVPGLFDSTSFLSYGRLRPATMSLLVYGFGGTLTQAIAYYLTPRLAGASLHNERLARLNGYAYSGVVAAGAIFVALTGSAGDELAEFPLLFDIAMSATLLVPAWLVTRTVLNRTEEGMHVSLLYVLGAVWWYPALYIVGSVGGAVGTANLLQTSFVSAGMLTLALPSAAVGAAFYVAVKETGNPLYSAALARAAFWTLAGTALVATPARFAAGPAPAWLETIAAVMSLGLAISALAVFTTLMLTMSGSWDGEHTTLPLKLILSGAGAYAFLMVLAGLQGFRSIGAVVGLTTWHEGIAIGVAFVAVPLLGLGFILHAFPRIVGRAVFRSDVASRGLRLAMWAGCTTALALILAGVITGLSWNFGVASGAFANTGAGFAQTLGSVQTLYLISALSSIVAVVGLALLVGTVMRTYTSGAVQASEVLVETVSDSEDADE